MHQSERITCLLLAFAGIVHPQTAELRRAVPATMPVRADCNSPVFWNDGKLHLLTSTGDPVLSAGKDQFSLATVGPIQITPARLLPIWFESVWQDAGGLLYAWYHHEPPPVCPDSKLTAPRIGAAVSRDGGKSFTDLGFVLESGDRIDCTAKNGFFSGGHGDFSVILDRTGSWFYFLFDNYGGDWSSQGIAAARMAFAHRANPVGAVRKYFRGAWNEPGRGGKVTPIFPVKVGWQASGTDAFWGASVHWNTHLESYVALISHSCCKPRWPQEGIYATFNPDAADPAGWSRPVRLMGKVKYDAGYYPQVIGTGSGESDTLAGRVARLWVHGLSFWEIVFHKAEQQPALRHR
jgi:hypothetical protein